jgi:hypothetical protein
MKTITILGSIIMGIAIAAVIPARVDEIQQLPASGSCQAIADFSLREMAPPGVFPRATVEKEVKLRGGNAYVVLSQRPDPIASIVDVTARAVRCY